MKIRSITCFFNPTATVQKSALKHFSDFKNLAIQKFNDAGIEVQTVRLATTSFPGYFPSLKKEEVLPWVKDLEAEAEQYGFSYLSLGAAQPDNPASFKLIPQLLAETKNVFFSGIMADRRFGVDMAAVKACAEVIVENTAITPDGFTNLRFSALANVPPGVPFFPSAYHSGSLLQFSLAVECADAACDAFSKAGSIAAARRNLLASLESFARLLTAISAELSFECKLEFGGIDFSLAPYPNWKCSLGGALEILGPSRIGAMGSLAAAAIVADALDQGDWQRAGFNGLMLPVLEDPILALRSQEGSLTLRDLLLFSAVCGTGLDTVPLPGDTTAEELAPVLADVAALSVRLDKPLTARLMPIPGKKAGDRTNFDFEYFENGAALEIPSAPLTGLLAKDEVFTLKPRRNQAATS